jgi:hypothetical protein
MLAACSLRNGRVRRERWKGEVEGRGGRERWKGEVLWDWRSDRH